jgi:GT2 family glycosyltransferase
MTVGVLITNYHAWATTEKTVEAILELHPDPSAISQLVIVDDDSDAPPHFPAHPQVQIHRNAKNLGYVASVNVGMALMTTDVVVVLDCDARPLTPFAAEMIGQFTLNPKLGAIGFTQTDETQNLRPAAEPTPTLREFIIGPAFFSRLPKLIQSFLLPQNRPLCIHSCCMSIRRSAFQDLGGFDESFDFLDGDMDFSWCLLENDWENTFTDKVLCFHPGSGSPQTTEQRVLRHHQNRWRLLKKHGHLTWPSLTKVLLGVRHFLENSALLLLCLTTKRPQFIAKLETRQKLLRSVADAYGNDAFTSSHS